MRQKEYLRNSGREIFESDEGYQPTNSSSLNPQTRQIQTKAHLSSLYSIAKNQIQKENLKRRNRGIALSKALEED